MFPEKKLFRYEETNPSMMFDNLMRIIDLIQTRLTTLETLEQPLYLFGAGKVGRYFFEKFCRNVRVAGFIDNRAQAAIAGADIYSLRQAAAADPGLTALITIGDRPAALEVLRQCRAANIRTMTLPYFFLPWLTDDPGQLPDGRDILMNKLIFFQGERGCDQSAARTAFNALSDNESLLYFLQKFAYDLIDYEGYFRCDLIKDHHCRAVVDAGAWLGDTLAAFKARTGEDYDHYYMIEPLPDICAQIRQTFTDPRISVHNTALAAEKGEISARMDALGMISWMEREDGAARTCSLPCDTLDNIIGDQPVTMIKMDIEGAEMEALRGAVNTIRRQRPALAICIYHKKNDISDIPAWIEGLGLGYKIYLRHWHHPVCYAVAD